MNYYSTSSVILCQMNSATNKIGQNDAKVVHSGSVANKNEPNPVNLFYYFCCLSI